eukprot:COSAG05_NODE_9644_length_610_cov_1.410959_1_plen_142_part_10
MSGPLIDSVSLLVALVRCGAVWRVSSSSSPSSPQAISTGEVAKLQASAEESASRALAAERRAEGLQRKLQGERIARTQAEVRADVQAAARERAAASTPPLEIVATERGRCVHASTPPRPYGQRPTRATVWLVSAELGLSALR